MDTLKQAFAISILAFIVGLGVNFFRSDSLSLFPSQTDDLFKEDNIKQISITDAQELLKDKETFFIDLRPNNNFDMSHIPGSLSFPAEKIYGLLERIQQEVPIEAKIILYGNDKEDTSPSVVFLFQMMGYSSIYIMTEGWAGWEYKEKNSYINKMEIQ